MRELPGWPGLIYGAVMTARAWLYGIGFFKTVKLPCKVISVGNLTTGGTGKTPAVIYLAKKYLGQNKKVVILSRGYGRDGQEKILEISGGKGSCLPWQSCGDEPFLMARKLSRVPIIIGPRRSETGQYAARRFSPDIIILDDAYQHLGVARNENILLVDSTNPFGNGRVLPSGILREPLSQIKRATRIFLTKTDQAENLDGLIDRLRGLVPGIPVIKTVHRVTGITRHTDGLTFDINPFESESWFAFAGVGSFTGFLKSLAAFGLEVGGSKPYRDHHRYRSKDLDDLIAETGRSGCSKMVTTEKDAVKIKKSHPVSERLYTLNIEFRLVGDEPE